MRSSWIQTLYQTEFRGRTWMLLRALFPSWRFFEDLDWVPIIRYRIFNSPEQSENWTECFPPVKRSLFSLFLNARGNLRMAAHSLVEQLAQDLADLPIGEEARASELVSYRLVENLVRFRIREAAEGKSGHFFQFKVSSAVPGHSECGLEDELFLSAVHEVGK